MIREMNQIYNPSCYDIYLYYKDFYDMFINFESKKVI